MKEVKNAENTPRKKTLRVENYDMLYKDEREMSDLLFHSHFGKSRQALGIENPADLKTHLDSVKPDHFWQFKALQTVNSKQEGSDVISLECVRDPYHAASLGICDLILSKSLPESDASRKLYTSIHNPEVNNSSTTLMDYISSISEQESKVLIAPLIRTMAVEYIQDHYDSIYHKAYEFFLQVAFYWHKQDSSDSERCLVSEQIQSIMNQCDTWYQMRLRWGTSGKLEYFNQLRENSEYRFWWESEIELSALELMFKVNIQVGSQNNSSLPSPKSLLTHVPLDNVFTHEEKELLCILKVCEKLADSYYLRLRPLDDMKILTKNIELAEYDSCLEDIKRYRLFTESERLYQPDSRIKLLIIRGLVSSNYLYKYEFMSCELDTLTPSLREKTHHFRRQNGASAIEMMTGSVLKPFTLNELLILEDNKIIYPSGRKKVYTIRGENGELDEKSILARIKGFPESIERISQCLKIDSPDISLKHDGYRWYYLRRASQKVKNNSASSSISPELSLDEIRKKIVILLQKNKVFQAVDYCMMGIKRDPDFFDEGRHIDFQQEYNIFLIAWNNCDKEAEFLKAIDEMSVDHFVIKSASRTEALAIFSESWPLKEFLKLHSNIMTYNKMYGVGLRAILAYFNCDDIMNCLSDSICNDLNVEKDIFQATIISAEYNKQVSLNYLERQYDVLHSVDQMGIGALSLAVVYGFKNAVQYLVQRGASVDIKDEVDEVIDRFESPFVLAAKNNNFELIQYFMCHSRDLISPNTLMRSIRVTQSLDIVRYIIPNITGTDSCTECIEDCITRKNDVSVIRYLFSLIVGSEKYRSLCHVLFEKAVSEGNLEIIMLCVNELGVNPNTKLHRNISALVLSCIRGYVDVVRFLIQVGVDPNQTWEPMFDGKFFYRPILCALFNDQLPMLKCLIEEARAHNIRLKQDDLTQEQLEIITRIQQELESEQGLKTSSSIIIQRQSAIADTVKSEEIGTPDQKDQASESLSTHSSMFK